MEAFRVRDFNDPKRKPSLNSVIEQRNRQAALKNGMADEENKEVYTESEAKMMAEAGAMSLVGHLSELRRRIIISVVCILIAFGIAYYYVDDLLQLLIAPAGKLYYMRPTEAFFTYMKVALVGGLIGASPIWLYQVWAFVKPALSTKERRLTNWFLPFAIILFLIGIVFSYFLVLPAAVAFFIGFSTDELQPMFSIGQYVDFVIAFILPFGIIFELPIIMIILAKMNMVTSAMLKKKRKIFIFLSFVIGAAISPTPDMFSQTMIALPMILLYEVSLWIVSRVMKK